MYGAGEHAAFGAIEHRPPWFGGSQVEVVPGRYRDGLHPLTATTFAWLVLPIMGSLPTDEFTVELFVKSSQAWASVAQTSMILQLQSDDDGVLHAQPQPGRGAEQVDHLRSLGRC